MGLRPLEIVQFFQRGKRLYTSESDVYRRQILTYNDGPRAERVKCIDIKIRRARYTIYLKTPSRYCLHYYFILIVSLF